VKPAAVSVSPHCEERRDEAVSMLHAQPGAFEIEIATAATRPRDDGSSAVALS
jgi:hypothetical protein